MAPPSSHPARGASPFDPLSPRSRPRPIEEAGTLPTAREPAEFTGAFQRLAGVFPSALAIRGAVHRVSAELSAFSGAAWYGLIDIDPATIGQNLVLFGGSIELRSAQVTVDGSDKAWGTTEGLGAAIVIGTRLPAKLGQWADADASWVPGVEVGGSSHVVTNDRHRVLWARNFPPGDRSVEEKQVSITHPLTLVPFVSRIGVGDRIQAALVLSSSYTANFTSGSFWRGYAAIELYVGLGSPSQDL